MNDVNNRIFYEFSEFLKETESVPPEMRVSLAYEITIKSTIASALIDLASENKLDERYWNHLRVQRNILDFLYALWLDDNRTLAGEFSTILKDLVEYDFSIADEHMKERLNIDCMKRLVSTLNLSKEDWLRYRKCGITGTDAGAILGVNPYRSAFQVYHDKISDTIEDIDNEAMRQGRDLEDYVAQRFSEETGLKARRANAIYQSEEHPLLLADFDRLIVGQKAGLECKTVSPFSADKWANGKIPAHYLAQVDHYLVVSGFDCWYVAALILGKELIIHKIVTDKQVLADLIDKEELFWTRYVVPQIPPAPNGSEGDTQQINQLYEVDNRDKNADLTSLRGLLDKRQELSSQIEQLEKEKTAIEQQVKLEMQDAAYGTAPGYKVSWVSSESKRVDSQRLRKEQPDIFNQYSKNVSSRRFTIVHAA